MLARELEAALRNSAICAVRLRRNGEFGTCGVHNPKVTERLVPLLIVCYFVAYLDRFAALTMNEDLGLSQTAYGFGAGIFFVAYRNG